jgi:hypothetical protein
VLLGQTGPGRLGADFVARISGLAAPPSDIFLYGYTRSALSFGPIGVELTGEFHLLSGALWAPLGASLAPLVPESLSFAGAVAIRDGTASLLEGGIRGSVVNQSGKRRVDATADVHFYWDSELQFGGVKLVKVWVDADLAVSAKLADYADAALTAQVGASAAIGEFAMKQMTYTIQVCFAGKCASVPVTVTVPDLSKMTWGTPFTTTLELRAAASSDPAKPRFTGSLTGSIPIPGGGNLPLNVPLPTLMPNLLPS